MSHSIQTIFRSLAAHPAVRWATAASSALILGLASTGAAAVPVFTSGFAGIAMGVANLGPPVSPGAPTYLLNNTNGRTDILTNPGLGLTANPVVANNTSSTPYLPFVAGQSVFLNQVGGGNINGPFGAGSAVITGDQFGFALSDGGIPGGVSASYEILTWDAFFTDAAGSLAGTIGTYIAMQGVVPLVQDLALVSLRIEFGGVDLLTADAIPDADDQTFEMPGLILAVERTGALSYNWLALQDNLNGGAGAVASPGGFGMLIQAATGAFTGLAYNVLPFNILPGDTIQATITATVYSDPSSLGFPADSFFDIFTEIDTGGGAGYIGGGMTTSGALPTDFLLTETAPVPVPAAAWLLGSGLSVIAGVARRRRNRTARH